MDIKAGSLIVGKIHKHSHLNIIISGRILVATEFGKKELHGGDVFVSEPGTKRAVLALEDTVWLCTHPNLSDTRDLDEIERYVIAPTYAALGHEQHDMKEVT
jgi:quercetin dioxygenase-like cupin family protein